MLEELLYLYYCSLIQLLIPLTVIDITQDNCAIVELNLGWLVVISKITLNVSFWSVLLFLSFF